jgi:hypothetical protein
MHLNFGEVEISFIGRRDYYKERYVIKKMKDMAHVSPFTCRKRKARVAHVPPFLSLVTADLARIFFRQ